MSYIVLLHTISALIAQALVVNPIADFSVNRTASDSQGRNNPLAEIEIHKVDISGDGVPELFLRNTDLPGDRAGVVWSAYTRIGKRFLRLNDLALFHPTMYYKGTFKGFEGTELASYHSSGSSGGTIYVVRLRDGRIETETVRFVTLHRSGPDVQWLEQNFDPVPSMKWTVDALSPDPAVVEEVLDYSQWEVKLTIDNDAKN